MSTLQPCKILVIQFSRCVLDLAIFQINIKIKLYQLISVWPGSTKLSPQTGQNTSIISLQIYQTIINRTWKTICQYSYSHWGGKCWKKLIGLFSLQRSTNARYIKNFLIPFQQQHFTCIVPVFCDMNIIMLKARCQYRIKANHKPINHKLASLSHYSLSEQQNIVLAS